MFILPYGTHRFTNCWCIDEPAYGGAHHEYVVQDVESPGPDTLTYDPHAVVHFQKGPVAQVGKNGCFLEDLLNICQHRLECFQAGPLAYQENAEALEHIIKAHEALDKRNKDRQSRGVEGTMER